MKDYISHRAAQDQALRTNSVKKLIENRFKTDVSRRAECVERESRDSEPSSIRMHCTCTETQYKSWRRARSVGISRKYGFERTENWFYNKPDPVCDSEKNKLLLDYDFKIQTDRHNEHNKPDINTENTNPVHYI